MLKLYTHNETTRKYSPVSAGTFEAPVAVRAVPNGSAGVHKVFIRNDDPNKFYTDIAITLAGKTVVDFIQESSLDCKILSGAAEPTSEEWDQASASGTLIQSPLADGVNTGRKLLPNLGAAGAADNNYYPLWIRAKASAPLRGGQYLYTIDISYTEAVI